MMVLSYISMGYSDKISIYYLSIIMNGLGIGMIRPAISSSLSISQSPENQGTAAGYLGSVIPIGHIMTPFVAMPFYGFNPSYLYYFSSLLCVLCIIFIISHPIFKKSGYEKSFTSS